MSATVSEVIEVLQLQADVEDCPIFVEQDGLVTEYRGVRIWIDEHGNTTGLVLLGESPSP